MLLSLRLLPDTAPSGHRFDLLSAVLCAVMFGMLVSAINSIGHSQRAMWIVAEFAGALAAGWLLVRRQKPQPMPMLPVDLFLRPIFALSVTTSVCSFIAQGLAFVSLPFYFQDVIGVSAVATGLLMTPWPAMTAVLAPIAGRLADRYPAGILAGIGLAVCAGGFVLAGAVAGAPDDGRHLVAGRGVRRRVRDCSSRRTTERSCRARRASAAAAPARSRVPARLLGQSIGAAAVALIFGLAQRTGGDGATIAILMAAGFAGVGVLTSLGRLADFSNPGHARAKSRAELGEAAE